MKSINPIFRGPSTTEAASFENDSKEKSLAIASAGKQSTKITHTPKIAAKSQPAVQRKCAKCEKEEQLQKKEKSNSSASLISAPFQSSLDASKGSGQKMDNSTNNFMSSKFGTSFDNVKLHNNSRANKMAEDINAKAFTVGENIYFGKGEYQPNTKKGQHLLAHELTHTVQQKNGKTNNDIQRASLISENKKFMFIGGQDQEFTFSNLISAVIKRYKLDHFSAYQVALWLNKKHSIFYNLKNKKYLSEDLVIPMPRMVAFFQMDYVEPFNPFDSSSKYYISPEAKKKTQAMWGQYNIFIGFKRGKKISNPKMQQIQFNPKTKKNGEKERKVKQERDLMGMRPSGALPPGYFHIVVTGSTTQDASIQGKSISVDRSVKGSISKSGILLFAGAYSRLNYKQTVPKGDKGNELGELLAHEIGHFLFSMTHTKQVGIVVKKKKKNSKTMKLKPTNVVSKDGFMKAGTMDPNDHLEKESLKELETAFSKRTIPTPEKETKE